RSLVVLLLIGCVSESPGGDAGPKEGEENGPCFSNGTCNTGLVCVIPNKCVRPDATTPETGSPDVGSDAPVVDAGPCPSTGLLAWWKADGAPADEENFLPLTAKGTVSYTTGH